MTNKTNKTNPRHLYWVALAIYTVIAAIFTLVQGDGDYIKHMEFIMIFFISGTVFDNRCDILRIKEDQIKSNGVKSPIQNCFD